MQMFGAETREWPDDTRCDLETLLCHDPVHCAALVRRSAVLAVGGYDEQMAHQATRTGICGLASPSRGSQA